MDEQSEMAVLAKSAYDWHEGDHELAQKELEAYGLGAYHFDIEHSDDHSVTIVRPDGAVISYRGTDFSNPSDLLADFQILAGVHSNPWMHQMHEMNRFQQARDKYEAVKTKHSNLILTGHSLGGAQALHVARAYDENAIVFNPGASPFSEPFHALLSNDRPQTIYTTGDDLISISSYLSKDNVVTVPRRDPKKYWSHSLVNFLPLRDVQAPVPTFLRPVHKETYETGSFCQIYPELCTRQDR